MVDVRLLEASDVERVCARLPLHRLGQPGGSYLVAWDGDEPVGHGHVDWREHRPELQDVYVLESFRRRGVASMITAAAEREAAERGHTALSLTVSERNEPAIALYERLGYRRTTDPPRRVTGTIQLRTGPLAVDDVLLGYVKPV